MTKALIQLYNESELLFTAYVNSDGYPSHTGREIVRILKEVKTVEHIEEVIPFLKLCNNFSEGRFISGCDFTYKINIAEMPITIQVLSYNGEEEFNGYLMEFEGSL